jgi:2-keto-3-deoxy-L-rhamnonate aldolase RhmA
MQPNRVKKILREGGLALGTYVGGIADPQIVEIIGHAGFDAAFIDMEHTSFDLRDVQLMVMAAERVGITPIVRTPASIPRSSSACSTWACREFSSRTSVMPTRRARP